MESLDIARWQFGITTVYHFLFVPLTIGLSFVVAWFQTRWHRTGDDRYLRLTKFYGKLFLINFALGLATGIVQEFQFGMNWSDYSRFVGDIFGAPLAIEGLLAFFLESTFLGLWIFGWGRLSPRLHLATIWLAAIGTVLSAYFILAANSFMQNPVGAEFNAVTGRAELTDFWAMLTNPVALITFPHTIFAAFLTSGGLVLGVALWRLVRRPGIDTEVYRYAARVGSVVIILAAVGVTLTGDRQAKVMTDVQPMKMAAAEALYDTTERAGFSIFTIGTLDTQEEIYSLRVPGLLSFLAEGDFNATVQGINDLQAEYEERFGADSIYHPNIPVTYWAFRLMIGVGLLAAVGAIGVLWKMRQGGEIPVRRWVAVMAVLLPLTGLLGNSFGWIFTEMGRQPWIVFGLMPTAAGVSPGVGPAQVLLSMIGFTIIYGILAFIEVRLIVSTVKDGLPEITEAPADESSDEDGPLVFAY
jgi:cytochrome bd ubiquinol oxidase subunit I